MDNLPTVTVAMVFSGGLGLAAYHAGVFEEFTKRGGQLDWLTGSSAGAVTATLIAGSVSERRIEVLQEFWNCRPDHSPIPRSHCTGWMGALRTRVFGSNGHFIPQLPNLTSFRSLYDLAPMKARLASLVDFGRLNGGEIRVSIGATDVESGEPVIFDSSRERIDMDHVLASCGFLPEFAPVEIGGRLLADGGLSINAPFEPVLEAEISGHLVLYVVDLYARDGERPRSLETALERKSDLTFGNQTMLRLRYLLENRRLRAEIGGVAGYRDTVVLLSYRPGPEEPGPEKSFDLSASGLAQRWKAGRLDMELARASEGGPGLHIIRRAHR
jgi:NTE family protein